MGAALKLTNRHINQMGRDDLLDLYERNRNQYIGWVRDMVIKHHRVDILCQEVLGYEVQPHHMRLLKHQYNNRRSLTLIWRGAGKTTVGTVGWSIFQLILDPNRRILLASKTRDNAKGFLKEIKTHFEANEKLKEIFGNFVGTSTWSDEAIEVRGRTKAFKEPSINTVGVDGAVASKHYDIINTDDLVDEENSRTKHQRDKMTDWYYKVLLPTLNPPDANDRFIGSENMIGTRYHYEDHYGRMIKTQPDGTGGEFAGDRTLIIAIEDDEGNPTWPERFPKEVIDTYRKGGIIRFNSQYKCNCDAMQGQIFQYDDCQVVAPDEAGNIVIPENLLIYHGVDLAISEDEEDDMFAQVVLGIESKNRDVYVLDYQEERLRFAEQTKAIIKFRRKWKPLRTGVESNAYQKAQVHALEDKKQKGIIPIYTLKDKVTRAHKMEAAIFNPKKVWFLPEHNHLREILVLFPNYRWKDLFDAFEIAWSTSRSRVRKKRAKEPGLI